MTDRTNHLEDLAAALLARAAGAGADAADVMVIDSTSISVSCRLGRTEALERSESVEAGLRVFIGKRQALASSADLSAEGMAALVERSLAMAREVPEDPFCGLAEPVDVCRVPPEVDSFDAAEPSAERLLDAALAAEDAARAVPGITNSEGAEASWGRSAVAIAASNGFAAAYRRSWNSPTVFPGRVRRPWICRLTATA